MPGRNVGDAMVATGWQVTLPRQGGTWRVGRVLGEGGQGSVFELHDDHEGRALALKWYRPASASRAQRDAIVRLTSRPAPSDAFLWPLELVDGHDGAFGYVMPLRPAEYLPLSDLLMGRVDVGFRTVARLAMELADCFLQLHAQGLCYRDISLGNVFFNPVTAHPLVCDNDNVAIEQTEQARVLGTSRFIAPEVIRDNAQPSIATDLYSLAVLEFYLLMVHHPLQGRRELEFDCFGPEAEQQLFALNPLFVFDPLDTSNAPDPAAHQAVLRYWPLYPSWIHREFTRAFTVGLHEPAARVREGVWRSRMSRLLDGVVICACGRENLTDDGAATVCWSCGQQIPAPPRIEIGDRIVVLNHDSTVTRHHLVRNYDYSDVVARVVRHPSKPGVWGLRNETENPWHVTVPGAEPRTVASGQSVGLVDGTVLDLGRISGTIHA